MSLDEEVAAIRETCALSRMDHVVYLRITGPNAYEAVDRLCPATMRLRDGQMMLTLLLEESGRPFADVQLGREDDSFLLVAEGPSSAALIDTVRQRIPGGLVVEIENLNLEHEVLALNGPYAWEVMAALVGPEIIGMPYGTIFRVRGWTCFRAGKTGEYGYELIVPTKEAAAVRQEILDLGGRFELREASLNALDRCALENWFFNIRREGRGDLSPLELQLQWRISYQKEYVGADALRRRRKEGATRRITCLVGQGPLDVGMELRYGGQTVGYIANADFSSLRQEYVAHGVLDLPFCRPGIEGFIAGSSPSGPSLRTVVPPVLRNRSLYINPQRHSIGTRAELELPDLRA